jgi:hypothetical protein
VPGPEAVIGGTPGAAYESRGLGNGPGAIPAGNEKNSLVGLLKELRDDTTTLLRQEVALAKTEISEKAAKAGRNAGYVAVGGAVLLVGAICLLTAVAWLLAALLQYAGLSQTNAIWISWLIVGGVITVIGYVLLQKGLTALKNINPVPEKTVQTLKEDKQWLANKVS